MIRKAGVESFVVREKPDTNIFESASDASVAVRDFEYKGFRVAFAFAKIMESVVQTGLFNKVQRLQQDDLDDSASSQAMFFPGKFFLIPMDLDEKMQFARLLERAAEQTIKYSQQDFKLLCVCEDSFARIVFFMEALFKAGKIKRNEFKQHVSKVLVQVGLYEEVTRRLCFFCDVARC